MKAVGIRAFGGLEVLEILDIPDPVCGDDEVVIGIRAAGVNPIDWKIREGLRKDRLPHRFPVVLGWDAAGVVEEIGANVEGFAVGVEVFTYGRKAEVHDGAYAERIAIPAALVAMKPTTLDFVHAAAVPLAASTAWQALDALEVEAGETILIHAAAGGVGAYAVQMARERGVRVIGTASEGRHMWLRELGCEHVIDYREGDVAGRVRALVPEGVDTVLDGAGGSALHDELHALRDGGRLVTIVEQPEDAKFSARGIRAQWIFAAPDGTTLERIARLVDEGTLRVHVEKTYPLEDAREALAHLEARHVRGKLVLVVRP